MTEDTTTPVAENAPSEDKSTDTTPPAGSSRRRRWPWITAFVVVFAMFVAAGAFAGATVSYADSLQGRLLPGTTIAGLDVGSMTHDEALQTVRGALREELDRTMVVRWKDRRWKTKAADLGARTNARRIITRVARSQTGLTWQDWARMRWFGERDDIAADVRVGYRRKAVQRYVAGIAQEVDAKPTDAQMALEGERVAISASAVGHRVQQEKVVKRLLESLEGNGKPVQLAVGTRKPEVVESDFSQVLVLDQSDHRLTLHLDGEKARSWIVAVGTGDHPTPLGRYSVTLKRYLPTWVNPAPDGWGKDMPAEIPPGKNNPLGVRALNWDAPAIRFHGTQAIDSLGTDASHGCVRMSNADVIELYDLVDVGAVIVSKT